MRSGGASQRTVPGQLHRCLAAGSLARGWMLAEGWDRSRRNESAANTGV